MLVLHESNSCKGSVTVTLCRTAPQTLARQPRLPGGEPPGGICHLPAIQSGSVTLGSAYRPVTNSAAASVSSWSRCLTGRSGSWTLERSA